MIAIVPVVLTFDSSIKPVVGGVLIFVACPGVCVAQSIIFKLIHQAFGFFQNQDYQLPNGVIIFDSYSCDKSGKLVKVGVSVFSILFLQPF